jgi:hypothetical protein
MDIDPVDVGIAAVVLPPVIAMINQRRWPAPAKGLTALAACLLYALAAVWLRGPVDFADWRNVALTVVGSALAAYKLWWQPSGIAPAIEKATSPSRRSPVA